MDYNEYEASVKKILDVNEEYLNKFNKWLREKKLTDRTIRNHIDNVSFYINDYLNYYEPTDLKHGCYGLESFFGDWFIRKCMWSTASSIKSTAASLKKFYQCMLEFKLIEKNDYQNLCDEIKKEMDEWIYKVNAYNSYDEDDDFFSLF